MSEPATAKRTIALAVLGVGLVAGFLIRETVVTQRLVASVRTGTDPDVRAAALRELLARAKATGLRFSFELLASSSPADRKLGLLGLATVPKLSGAHLVLVCDRLLDEDREVAETAARTLLARRDHRTALAVGLGFDLSALGDEAGKGFDPAAGVRWWRAHARSMHPQVLPERLRSLRVLEVVAPSTADLATLALIASGGVPLGARTAEWRRVAAEVVAGQASSR